MSGEIAKLFVSIGADIKEFQRGMQGVQKQMASAGKSMSAAGATLTKNVTLPLVAIGGAAFAAANEMDKAMKTIRAGTGATGASLQALNEDFKEVFKTVPQDAGAVSSALADLNTRTGLTGQALQDLTRQMLNLARVSGDDVNSIVESTTRLFGDWDVATRDQAKSLDYLWKVSQETGIGVDSLSRKMVQYGAPLRQMGFEMETAAAIMGKFEKEGVNLELVMGSLRIALGNFAREGEEAPQALQRLISDIQAMESGADATALAMEIFGARAGPDMAAAIREGRFEIDDLMKSLNASGETVNKAAEDTLNFSESMAIMKNEAMISLEPLGKVLLELFREFQPLISQAIAFIARLTEAFANQTPEMQKLIVSVAGLVAALGPVLVVVGKVVTAIAAIAPVLIKIGAAIAAFVASPVALIIAAIAAVAAGVYLVIRNWEQIKGFFAGVVASIRQSFAGVTQAIVGPFERARDRLVGIGDNIKASLNKINPFARFSPSLVDNVKAGVDEITKQYESLGGMNLSPVAHNVSSSQSVNHTGTIRVEGVNSRGELVAVVDAVMDRIGRTMKSDDLRIPSVTRLVPID